MKRSKILIIDKDILVRQAIANVLQKEPAFDVRVSGEIEDTVNIIHEINPDVVLLNLGNPEQENLEKLSMLRFRLPKLPVAVLIRRTEEGASAAIEALWQGAVDFITKPENGNTMLFAERHLVKRLLPLVQVSLQVKDNPKPMGGSQHEIKEFDLEKEKGKGFWPVTLVVIGACTGGPGVLFLMLPQLLENLSVPIVIAQHFPKKFTKVLAMKLDKICKIPVQEAYEGAELLPGTVWLAPGGFHCEVQREGNRSYLRVHRGPRENGMRPSIDVLFRSAAGLYGPGALGVILSGSGKDGLAGARYIRQAGGRIIVQNPQTATAPELPLSIIEAGLSDGCYTDKKISEQIIKQTSGTPVDTGTRRERAAKLQKKHHTIS